MSEVLLLNKATRLTLLEEAKKLHGEDFDATHCVIIEYDDGSSAVKFYGKGTDDEQQSNSRGDKK